MKKIFFITLLIVISNCKSIANAQIKVVDDDYRSSLTAAKSYYEQDIEFERVFPKAYLGAGYNVIDMGVNCSETYNSIEMTIPTNLNCLGDTLWNYSNKDLKHYGLRDRMEYLGFGIMTDGEKEEVTWKIPMGYYVVSGYIIGRENLIKLLSMHFNEEDTTSILHYKDSGSGNWTKEYYGIGKTRTIKQLKEAILLSEFKYLPNEYIAYVKLSSVDTINNKRFEYYTPRLSELFNVKFYDEIRKQFLNKKIILVQGDQIEFYKNKKNNDENLKGIGAIWSDAMTDEKLKLADSMFTVEDVVVKLKKERDRTVPHLYAIVKGENTGSFAIEPQSIEYKYYVQAFDDIRDGMRHPNYTNYGCPNLKLETNSYYEKFNAIRENDYKKIWQLVTDSINIINKEVKQKKLIEEKQRLSYQKERELKEIQRKENFRNSMITKYGLEKGQLIGNKRIAIGMTKEMCKDAWGHPMNIYRTTIKYGQSEVWCYNYKTRVYFFNNKVVQIDN